ncbi:uncharacterized protein STEHIDRAFT_141044 [Stereum hirsutum FP-91666 SS1]|uniref:uncharacterized protein n=1 Tax=Stereum hirsutum (strain FP-91666) TaxID=721885 RepID=UPI00044499EC|nr:uncharacterized protein STEHIDRAFT_141044 [Stereum hirsutum FP-91666 SS1]EIM83190.1 hypothetical protein STEHIDRAFT_141044 [Stereum hirsutum FP-91666 SS1]
MAYDNHVRRGHTAIFTLLLVFAIIELAISAWLTSRFNAHHDFPSLAIRDRTRYVLFCCAFTIFFGFLFELLFLHSASSGSVMTSVASHFGVWLLAWILWTAAAASVTAGLGGGLNCSGAHIVYCGQLNALEAFAWVEWILVTIIVVAVLVLGIGSLRRGDGYRGQLVTV